MALDKMNDRHNDVARWCERREQTEANEIRFLQKKSEGYPHTFNCEAKDRDDDETKLQSHELILEAHAQDTYLLSRILTKREEICSAIATCLKARRTIDTLKKYAEMQCILRGQQRTRVRLVRTIARESVDQSVIQQTYALLQTIEHLLGIHEKYDNEIREVQREIQDDYLNEQGNQQLVLRLIKEKKPFISIVKFARFIILLRHYEAMFYEIIPYNYARQQEISAQLHEGLTTEELTNIENSDYVQTNFIREMTILLQKIPLLFHGARESEVPESITNQIESSLLTVSLQQFLHEITLQCSDVLFSLQSGLLSLRGEFEKQNKWYTEIVDETEQDIKNLEETWPFLKSGHRTTDPHKKNPLPTITELLD